MKSIKYTMPIVIFAGGKSSRMGTDKALLPFKGFSTLTEFQHHKLSHYFNTLYISTKTDKFNFEANLILDTSKESSPLIGIVSIFEKLKEVDEVFILSVDTPLVSKAIFDTLILKNEKKYDAIIAHSPKGIEPLCGIYKRTAIPFIEAQSKQNNHKLTYLLETINTKHIPFKHQKEFTNLNYLKEYEEVFLFL